MNINFPPVDENFIKSRVEAGYYSNATEMVRDAVRRLRESEPAADGNHSRILAALRQGKEDADAGRVAPYNIELKKKIMRDARKKAAAGGPFDPDVVGPEEQEPWE